MESQTTQALTIYTYTPLTKPTSGELEAISSFLFKSLEQYGDPLHHIQMAIAYALDLNAQPGQGGLVICAQNEHGAIQGAVVINATGMAEYIPENILVYIAVDASTRGQGIGKQLMQTAIKNVKGGIALHVEPDNPARKLYSALGFTSKYLEMRFQPQTTPAS